MPNIDCAPTVSDKLEPMNEKLEDLLYAPIGLVANASEFLPELADRGRQQVANARVMGRMATTMGRQRAGAQVGRLGDALRSFLVGAGLLPPEQGPEPTVTAADRATSRPARAEPPEEPPEVTRIDAPASETLAIVEYDSLAASQVVPRLAALDPDELEDVRRYELAHRGRKTILGRIAQLQG